MKVNMLEEFKTQNSSFIGLDEKYHTVYVIEFITGEYYFGKHSTNNLNDSYFASGILPNLLRNKNIPFNRRIIGFFKTAPDAIAYETSILENKKYYDKQECLNCYPGSPPDATGSIVVSFGNKFKMINPKLLEYYLERGWVQSPPLRKFITDGVDTKKVLIDDLEKYLNDGWCLGSLAHRERNFIEKNGVFLFVKKTKIPTFLLAGWSLRTPIHGRKVLRKGDVCVKVHERLLDEYINKGFVPSSTVEGLTWVKNANTGEMRRIGNKELKSFLESGWRIGSNSSDTIYINDGVRDYRISEKDLYKYPHMKEGRVSKLYMNNGVKEKRIYPNDTVQINKLVADGYALGKLARKKKTLVWKDGKKKYVFPSDVQNFIDLGWSISKNYSGS